MAAGPCRPPADHPGGSLYHKQERHMIPIPRKMDRIEGWPLVVYMSLGFGSWLLSHLIYLKLRKKKKMFAKLSKFTK